MLAPLNLCFLESISNKMAQIPDGAENCDLRRAEIQNARQLQKRGITQEGHRNENAENEQKEAGGVVREASVLQVRKEENDECEDACDDACEDACGKEVVGFKRESEEDCDACKYRACVRPAVNLAALMVEVGCECAEFAESETKKCIRNAHTNVQSKKKRGVSSKKECDAHRQMPSVVHSSFNSDFPKT